MVGRKLDAIHCSFHASSQERLTSIQRPLQTPSLARTMTHSTNQGIKLAWTTRWREGVPYLGMRLEGERVGWIHRRKNDLAGLRIITVDRQAQRTLHLHTLKGPLSRELPQNKNIRDHTSKRGTVKKAYRYHQGFTLSNTQDSPTMLSHLAVQPLLNTERDRVYGRHNGRSGHRGIRAGPSGFLGC